jgi:hypothetical protein
VSESARRSGAALDNVPIGIAIGVAIGVAGSAALGSSRDK